MSVLQPQDEKRLATEDRLEKLSPFWSAKNIGLHCEDTTSILPVDADADLTAWGLLPQLSMGFLENKLAHLRTVQGSIHDLVHPQQGNSVIT